MSERHPRDRQFVIAPLAANDPAMPAIETPVIDIQDLEYTASDETRVNNKGVQVRPGLHEPMVTEEIDLSGDAQKARDAIAELEQQYAKLPPR